MAFKLAGRAGMCTHGGTPDDVPTEHEPTGRAWVDQAASIGPGWVFATADGLYLSVERNQGDCACSSLVVLGHEPTGSSFVLGAGSAEACLAAVASIVGA